MTTYAPRARRLTAAILTTFMLGGAASIAEARDVKLGHLAPEVSPRHEALSLFADIVRDETGGELNVQIFPNSTLGSEREMFEQLQAGVTELALVGSVVSNFYERWAILDMPFLWTSRDHVSRFFASGTVEGWAEEMEEELGVVLLSFFQRTPRILSTVDRPITRIEDLQGLKVRVPEITSFVDTWRAFGVQPVPVPASDIYMSMRLGMIDGMENPVEVMWNFNIHEVAKHLSLTEHNYSGFFFLASSQFFDGLDADTQALLRRAAAAAEARITELDLTDEASLFERLKEAGMEVTVPDVSGFVEASRSVHETYMERFGRDAYEAALELADTP